MKGEIGEDGGKEVFNKLACVLARDLGPFRLDGTRFQRRKDVLDGLGDVGVEFSGKSPLQRVSKVFALHNVWLTGDLGRRGD